MKNLKAPKNEACKDFGNAIHAQIARQRPVQQAENWARGYHIKCCTTSRQHSNEKPNSLIRHEMKYFFSSTSSEESQAIAQKGGALLPLGSKPSTAATSEGPR